MREIEYKLKELLLKGLEAAEQTGEFLIDQAPELLEEFYRWHFTRHVFLIFLSILIFVVVRYAPYLWLHNESTGRFSIKFFF